MGHLKDKYNEDYFLGGVDFDTGKTFGALGHEDFKEGSTEARHLENFEFTRTVAGTVEGKDVLEIGFGRGDYIPLFLKENVASYTGIDFSESSVKIAKGHIKDAKVNLLQVDATHLDEKNSYDIIGLYDVVEHIPVFEMEAVWKKIRRVLNPCGYIVISTSIFNNPNVLDHSDLIPSVSGMRCHKQTWGTLVRAAIKYNFTIASTGERTLALIRTEDLKLFGPKIKNTYLTVQAELFARIGISSFNGKLTPSIEQRLVSESGRLVIGCVADNKPKYLSHAIRLLQSLRWFGGNMAGANFFVCVVEEVDPDYLRLFERLGAFVRVVKRFSELSPTSNKLRFLELPDIGFYDTVMLIDCDTIIVQDPQIYINCDALQVKIADLPTISHEIFKLVFRHFGIELPVQKYKTNPSGLPTIWYCNTGVLIFSKEILNKLVPVWLKYTRALLDNIDLLGEHKTHYCEQTSLALAFAATCVPFKELPIEMNFPLHLTHLKLPRRLHHSDPIILHYHDKIEPSGYLQASTLAGAQKRIAEFNHRAHKERRKSFNNKLFWDERYSQFPDLGSGIGARGVIRAYKQELLRAVIGELKPKSILDVGCGDQAVSQVIPDDIYIGVDISSQVIEKNRKSYPSRKFVCKDIMDIDLPQADLIICMDVLIHIGNGESYRAFVEKLVSLTGKTCLAIGYEESPSIEHDITFFHEPLSKTLLDFGAKNLRKAGEYRNVVIWMFETQNEKRIMDNANKNLKLKPIFLVGAMRSGTTLFAKLLDEFEDIIHPSFELKGIWSQVGEVPSASPKTRDTTCPQLNAQDVKAGQAEKLKNAFLKEAEKSNEGRSSGAYFLNKNPHLCNKLPFVDTLFPDARFIWIFRHLPYVVASLKSLFEDVNRRQQTWHYWPEPKQDVTERCWEAFHLEPPPDTVDKMRCFPGGDVRYFAEYWLESNRAVANYFKKLPSNKYLSVQFENLIKETDIQLARCLGFLGLPLTVNPEINKKTDVDRNKIWISRLTSAELYTLLEFVKANATEINSVLGGKVSEFYIKTISDAVNNYNTYSIKNHFEQI